MSLLILQFSISTDALESEKYHDNLILSRIIDVKIVTTMNFVLFLI